MNALNNCHRGTFRAGTERGQRLVWMIEKVKLAAIFSYKLVRGQTIYADFSRRPDVHLAVGNGRHGEFHGLSGLVGAAIRTVPEFRGEISCVISV